MPGVQPREVRSAADLAELSGLILPGGESTVQLWHLEERGLFEPIARACQALPVWGVCAGAILLAREVRPRQPSLGSVDVVIERNAYGRQVDSFTASIEGCSVAFIRAPRVVAHGPRVRVRATHDSAPVWLEQGAAWLTTFHPELSSARPSPFHEEFARRCAPRKAAVR